jgi:hypothetical protein
MRTVRKIFTVCAVLVQLHYYLIDNERAEKKLPILDCLNYIEENFFGEKCTENLNVGTAFA